MSSPQPIYMQYARTQLAKTSSIPARAAPHRSSSAGCNPCSSSPASSSFTDLYLRHKASRSAQQSVVTPALGSTGTCIADVACSARVPSSRPCTTHDAQCMKPCSTRTTLRCLALWPLRCPPWEQRVSRSPRPCGRQCIRPATLQRIRCGWATLHLAIRMITRIALSLHRTGKHHAVRRGDPRVVAAAPTSHAAVRRRLFE